MKRHKILILTIAILGILFPSLSIIAAQSHAEADLVANQSQVFDNFVEKDEANTPAVDEPATELANEPVVEPAEEPAKEPVAVEPAYQEPAYQEPVYQEPVYTEPVYQEPIYQEPVYQEPVYEAPAYIPDHIEVAGNWVSVYNVNSTALDAGNSVYRFIDPAHNYFGTFLYGHNSWNVFGGLVNLGIGSTFTVTLDNVTTTYQVADIVVFEKNTTSGKLQLNGEGSYMNSVARSKFNGVQYSLSLMTCHGQSYGNGDASHRLVIFANVI